MSHSVALRAHAMAAPAAAAPSRLPRRLTRVGATHGQVTGTPRLALCGRPVVHQMHGRLVSAGASRFLVLATDEVDLDEVLLEIEDDAMTRMEKAVNSVKANFSTIRTGRATPNMLDRVEVEYYGEMTPIKSVAGISTPDASTLAIQPFDPSAMGAIERAIMTSDLDLTPNNDGKIIRIRIPPLTEERRKEMTKKTNALGEEGKVAVRNVRRDALKALGKLESASEDIIKGMETEIQKMTDENIKKIEQLTAAKNKDLTTL